ncbi:MAG: EamA family transporter [Bdellovibrionaceae bacterium]|nr:EamA family transporter [Pseudobdellovibrionaceae bacterium]
MNDWRVFALASAVFAALTAIFGKIGVTNINSNYATFLRTIIIVVMTLIIVSIRKEWVAFDTINKKSLFFLFLSAMATGASWLCYYRALQLGPASKVAPIDKLSVAFVILLSFIFLGETIKLKTIIGGLLIVVGSIVLAF